MSTTTPPAFPDGTHLAYTLFHETWWWSGLPSDARPHGGRPAIQVKASAKGVGGGCRWEFGVVEYDVSGRCLRLLMFDEAWPAFTLMPSFFAKLPDCDTLDAVREVLDELGAVDETERVEVKA